MDPYTNSLNSQLQMLEINQRRVNQDQLTSGVNQLSIQFNDNFSIKTTPTPTPPSTAMTTYNNSSNNGFEEDLPNDINTLRNLLEMRVKYTRPKTGGYWEFNNIQNDVNFLKDCIRFIDKHCAEAQSQSPAGQSQLPTQKQIQGSAQSSRVSTVSKQYYEYLEPLEMTAKELDLEFGIRFYNHFSFTAIRKQLIETVESSNMEYLAKVLKQYRAPRQAIIKSWEIYPNNKLLTKADYVKFYDRMDSVFKEWILEYCITSKELYQQCLQKRATSTTYELLKFIESVQDVSFQIKLLIDILVQNTGGDDYLNESEGFMPYLTYVEHLQQAIECSLPECENPYRTAMMLVIIIRGMMRFPHLLQEFQLKLEKFLITYPNFTLGELAHFLQSNNFPNVSGMPRISN